MHAPDLLRVDDKTTILKWSIASKDAANLIGEAAIENNDLVPGKYEGGFKIWEGSRDLAQYINDQSFPATRAIELGCGHGLPGLIALLQGAEVHFSDYNKEVLENLTMPNVASNWRKYDANRDPPPVRFFTGDWSHLIRLLDSLGLLGTYDLVLSAETAYNAGSIQSLVTCMKKCLKKPHGVAIISGKTYYFGVGGGMALLRSQLSLDNELRVTTLATINDGNSNVREIIKIDFN